MSGRVRVVGSMGPFVRIEVDGKPITITEQDALALSARLLAAVFQTDPVGHQMIVEALEELAIKV